jgi:hypothetical protein
MILVLIRRQCEEKEVGEYHVQMKKENGITQLQVIDCQRFLENSQSLRNSKE